MSSLLLMTFTGAVYDMNSEQTSTATWRCLLGCRSKVLVLPPGLGTELTSGAGMVVCCDSTAVSPDIWKRYDCWILARFKAGGNEDESNLWLWERNKIGRDL